MRDGALTLYSEVVSTPVRWLWYPFIAVGKITLLHGDPGDGKSTMMMNLIATVSTASSIRSLNLFWRSFTQAHLQKQHRIHLVFDFLLII